MVFHRIGHFLGLSSDPEPLEVRWEEPGGGDEELRRVFFALDVENLDEGTHSGDARTAATVPARHARRR